MKKFNFPRAKYFVIPAIAGAIIGSAALLPVSATAKDWGHHHQGQHGLMTFGEGMFDRFYKITDHLDLTEAQEQQVDTIIKSAKAKLKPDENFRSEMKNFIVEIKPDDPAYEQKLQEIAEDISVKAKEHVLLMGQVRRDVFNLLTEDQRTDLDQWISKRAERFAKHHN